MLNELVLLSVLALEVVIIWLGTMCMTSQVEEKETELKDRASFFLSSSLLVSQFSLNSSCDSKRYFWICRGAMCSERNRNIDIVDVRNVRLRGVILTS